MNIPEVHPSKWNGLYKNHSLKCVWVIPAMACPSSSADHRSLWAITSCDATPTKSTNTIYPLGTGGSIPEGGG